VRFRLRAYWRKIAPEMHTMEIPTESLESKGYITLKKLGEGSFGVVSLVRDRQGNEFCLKKVAKSKIGGDGLEELKREYAVMHLHGDHPRMGKTFGIFQDAQHIIFLNDACAGGDLADVAQNAQAKGVPITEPWFQLVFGQCFEGLAYMHRNAMMHCDIKEQNILLRTGNYDHPEAVLIDYGVTRDFTSVCGKVSGTPGYIPPETWQSGQWYPRGDCFSMGVTMLQMMGGHVPGRGRLPIFAEGGTDLEQWAQIVATRPAPVHLLQRQFPGAVPLISSLLNKRRPDRPASIAALSHEWLAGPDHMRKERRVYTKFA